MVSAFYPLFFVVLIKIRETIFWLHPIFGLFDCFLILFFYAQNFLVPLSDYIITRILVM